MVTLLSACAVIGKKDQPEPTVQSTVTTLGNATQLQGQATLVCSPECSGRGFCGTTPSNEQVILMNTKNPSTEIYDWFMLAQGQVTINEFQSQTAIYMLNNVTEVVNFYHVRNDRFEQAWVAGWCLGQ